MTIQFDEDKQKQKLEEWRKKEEEDFAKIIAEKYGVEYISLALMPINTDALRLIKEETARRAGVAAFNLVGKKVQVAVISPAAEETKTALKALTEAGFFVTVFTATGESLAKAWSHYKELSYSTESTAGALDVSSDEIAAFLGKVHSISDIAKLIEGILAEKKSYRISRLIEIILAGALATKASDVHIEPEEDYARLRYRLDGVLNDILKFDKETYALINSRIKLLSGLKLNVKTEAQDGRFSVKINEDDIEIRTSLLPGAYSESIVMRILNPKSIAVPIEELGIEPKLLATLEHEIAKPYGMILTTGPTGSGKTTTLYAFLRKVHTADIKIITIEDPIEYHLPGIVQTQTNVEKGYSFLEGLRSALRQDPDIIMVGEIRDNETAEIAVNAALTGHLVFSTLHTNTAAGTFPRLIDLGVNVKTMSSAINVSMAQRLVRKLCVECRKEATIAGKEKILIDNALALIKNKATIANRTKMWIEVGCDACNHTGFKGRIGIYEAILMNEAIEAVVRQNPSEREIQKAALPQGILTMKEDGIMKVLAGVTSLKELGRVVDLEKE
ncbi:MAG: type II/IV secretion system protein [Candidatus Taylorbacteria bacterium]|nr:type II/IV secretion system protein [Candidatus Taylorbacteria bacterium]